MYCVHREHHTKIITNGDTMGANHITEPQTKAVRAIYLQQIELEARSIELKLNYDSLVC